MRIILNSEKWEEAIKTLMPREVSLFMALVAAPGGVEKCLKLDEMVQKTGLCIITVRRALIGLEKAGMVKVNRVYEYNEPWTMEITVNPEWAMVVK